MTRAVRAENTEAIRLYEKLGFKIFFTSHYDILVRTRAQLHPFRLNTNSHPILVDINERGSCPKER